MSMKVEGHFNEEKNHTEVALQGEIDIYGSSIFKEKVRELTQSYPDKDMVFDMKELEYIDSTGLGVLIGALKVLKTHSKGITLKNLKPNVYKVFKITNLTQIFTIVDENESANIEKE